MKINDVTELAYDQLNEGFKQGYEQGRADAIEEIKELAHEDVTTGNMIISLADVEKLKDNN